MAKLNKLFIFWIVLFSLVSVLLANGISFHSENESASEVCAVVTLDQHDAHTDPCNEGFCHLGHCSSVTFVKMSENYISFDFAVRYRSVIHSLLERSLESPFQPPRAI